MPTGVGSDLSLTFPVSVPEGLHLEADGPAAQVVDAEGGVHFVVPAPVMCMPLESLPEMTFCAAADTPPIVLFAAPATSDTPPSPFPRSSVPVLSVPM